MCSFLQKSNKLDFQFLESEGNFFPIPRGCGKVVWDIEISVAFAAHGWTQLADHEKQTLRYPTVRKWYTNQLGLQSLCHGLAEAALIWELNYGTLKSTGQLVFLDHSCALGKLVQFSPSQALTRVCVLWKTMVSLSLNIGILLLFFLALPWKSVLCSVIKHARNGSH